MKPPADEAELRRDWEAIPGNAGRRWPGYRKALAEVMASQRPRTAPVDDDPLVDFLRRGQRAQAAVNEAIKAARQRVACNFEDCDQAWEGEARDELEAQRITSAIGWYWSGPIRMCPTCRRTVEQDETRPRRRPDIEGAAALMAAVGHPAAPHFLRELQTTGGMQSGFPRSWISGPGFVSAEICPTCQHSQCGPSCRCSCGRR